MFLHVFSHEPVSERRTKIVATIGPSSDSPETLDALIAAGLDCARISLSHGTTDDALTRIRAVRAAAQRARRHVGVLADLPGPKVRAASFPDGGVRLVEATTVRLVATGDGSVSDERTVAVELPEIVHGLRPGDLVALGDGAVQMRVTDVHDDHATATVVAGGLVQGRPGVSLPSDRFTLRAPTDEDLALLEVVAGEVDAIALSFVRSAADLKTLRSAIPAGPSRRPMLIAKIETEEAVADLDSVIAAADGVMVARGDLGIRLPVEEVPHIQQRIITTAVAFGRPVITATQMLESMVHAPVPTRAEVADITTAVLMGTSGLMLSGETAVGSYPVEAVSTMARIAARADEAFDNVGWGRALGGLQNAGVADARIELRILGAVSAAAWRATIDASVAAVICCTRSGASARAVTRFRPGVPVLAATTENSTAQQLSISWGVHPLGIDVQPTTDDLIVASIEAAREAGWVKTGDLVAVVVGAPHKERPVADTVRLAAVP